jgi:lipopolysaccharide transport system permease protein
VDVRGRNEVVIRPGAGFDRFWRELWEYRELFAFFAWRDFLVRYKQTFFGIGWSVLRPVLTTVVFTLVFGRLASLPSGGAPYPILVFAALLPWQLFANSLGETSNAVVSHANMISKTYFPRVLVVAGTVLVNLVDFLLSFAVLLLLMVWYRFLPGWRIVTLPLFLVLALVPSLGCGLWLAALNVRYRDVRHVVPFLVQAGLFISPVGFSSEVIPESFRLLYSLNPVVGVIDGFRWVVLGEAARFHWPGFSVSIAVSFVIFFLGFRYFRRTERTFADLL